MLARQGIRAAAVALGEDRIESGRLLLGLRPTVSDRPLGAVLAPPTPRIALPLVYERLFSDQALEAGGLMVPLQDELQEARSALDAAQSVAIIGVDAAAMSWICSAIERGLGPRRVKKITLSEPVTCTEVASWFEDDSDAIRLLIGFEWLFTLEPGGMAPLQRFVAGLSAMSSRAGWLLRATPHVWNHAGRVSGLSSVIGHELVVQPLSPDELAHAVLARHQMSGYAISVSRSDDIGWRLQHLLLRGQDLNARRQEAWFRTLHKASGGVVHDALLRWMASIEGIDDDSATLELGTVPRPPATRLEHLPDHTKLVLLQVARQGWINESLYMSLFSTTQGEAAARLGGLARDGLLTRHDDRYRFPSHLVASIHQTLAARGWL